MNSPYEGKFKVSQQYTLGTHDGLDLVGIDSKEIHSCANAEVIHVGWENAANHKQGFGYYVATKDDVAGKDGVQKIRYYGHLTENSARVKVGDKVKITDVLGIEGHTGYVMPDGPGGAHCHYEIRSAFYKGAKVYDVCAEAGIPNVKDGVYDDGYRPKQSTAEKKTIEVMLEYEGHKYSGLLEEL
ncbi:M23 family metallopeptidase [Ruminococcus flavefaciens]|uniref:M23 family metallopeptidase n=1 Tax=Ruminococcus flavefaciens TaxID=1265 RepID=UPI0013DA3D51|nr:M23 family metallopeptidase [Ruminococcus flavefaciens]